MSPVQLIPPPSPGSDFRGGTEDSGEGYRAPALHLTRETISGRKNNRACSSATVLEVYPACQEGIIERMKGASCEPFTINRQNEDFMHCLA